MEQYRVSRSTFARGGAVTRGRVVGGGPARRTDRRAGPVPRPETLARPAGLLLQVSGATFADVMAGGSGVEPVAVYLLAQKRTPRDLYELESWLIDC